MIFPLNNYKHEIPTGDALGAFGVTRKHDMHTGVDLYCNEGDEVRAMCDGKIVAIEWFTGPSVQMPWWNDTQAVAIRSNFGTINYGEVKANSDFKVGDNVKAGDLIGWVTPVLKKERAKVHMRKREDFVWNATNITTQLRGQLIDLFESYGGKVKITYVEVPYKTLIQQNSNREAAVPLPVIERMIGKLEIPQYDEAFDIDYFVK